MNINRFVIVIFFTFVFSRTYIEFDIGSQTPQGSFSKYNDSGISVRMTITHVDDLFPFVRYDLSIQRLQFKNDTWLESYGALNGLLTYENSEQAWGLFLGPRFMSPTKRGAFRPYAGFKVGGMFFSETLSINWEEEDDSFMECASGTLIGSLVDADYDCNGDTRLLSKKFLDSSFDFGALIEIGANLNFSDNFGLDIGFQYNIIPSIRPEVVLIEDSSQNAGFNEISKTINADYTTFYIGVNFKVND
ncbi:MAG: hypothetical protein CMG00_01410 [Candidatus Marinimicrobia bacterium]|nr:hypothetical protein [Candidatus Neomarinimicrobiota bacterium]